MSKLQELIDRLCPDGVEFKPLGEVCEIKRGERVTKNQVNNIGSYPVISGGVTPMGYLEKFNREANTITVAQYGTAGFVNWQDKRFWANDICYSLFPADVLDNRFLYYFLKNSSPIIDKLVNRDAVPFHLPQNNISNISIPIPPLEVQDEIVKILDRFADYAAELQAELQARRLQYEYYRNLLLTFNPSAYGCGTDDAQKISVIARGGHSYEIQWKTMGEIFEMRNGYTPSKNKPEFWENGTIPWFRMEDIRENGRILADSIQHITPASIKGKGLFEANTFILATTATIGEHALLIADSLANQRFTNLKVRKSLANLLDTKFIFYYMFIVDEFCKNNTNVSGFASVDMGKLKQMPFPIPPLELQEKIVAILDRFETLVNDLSKGLPAEIEAVKARYEYYRNKLLTFNPLSA